MTFEYTEEIAQRLPTVLHEALGCHVRSVERLLSGQVTYAFRVEADGGPMLVKVFRYAHVPRRETVTFVEETLARVGIRHAETRYFDATDAYFPHGFLIGEWITGPLVSDALKDGSVSRDAFCAAVAALLRQVHAVRFDTFGFPPLRSSGEQFPDLVAFMRAEDRVEELHALVDAGKADAALIAAGQERLERCYAAIDFPVQPVLVHGDPSGDNVIQTADGPVLIDWDNATITSWVHDLAWITFWCGPAAYAPFMRGYGATGEDETHIRALEAAFHTRLALQLPHYFAFILRDETMTAWAIRQLQDVLAR
ncbi:MAG: aminoglycoside phosphotransferase family protein [Chloroflexota bacterium]|nr:aminoglycoside phosphotransferase family protein [Chloroflexota bacterium]